MPKDPFHEGERRVQQRVGETDQADRNSPMISPLIPAGAIPFLHEQSLLVLAILHRDAMWCLPTVGHPGWMSANRSALHLDLRQTIIPLDERILQAARNRQPAGAIVLDFATRRRLRLNGHLDLPSEDQIVLTIAEAYPNCPKYITQRTLAWSAQPAPNPLQHGQSLTPRHREALRQTDILFLATQHPERGPDASHRGGTPGFVETPHRPNHPLPRLRRQQPLQHPRQSRDRPPHRCPRPQLLRRSHPGHHRHRLRHLRRPRSYPLDDRHHPKLDRSALPPHRNRPHPFPLQPITHPQPNPQPPSGSILHANSSKVFAT